MYESIVPTSGLHLEYALILIGDRLLNVWHALQSMDAI